MAAGVWVLSKDSTEDPNASLDAKKWTFVRDGTMPQELQPQDGYRFVKTANGGKYGFVHAEMSIYLLRRDGTGLKPFSDYWGQNRIFRALPMTDKVGNQLSEDVFGATQSLEEGEVSEDHDDEEPAKIFKLKKRRIPLRSSRAARGGDGWL